MNEKEVYLNYKRNNKWLGIIDYKSLVFFISYVVVIWNLINLINIPLEYKVYISICLIIPVLVIICININSESAIEVVLIILRFSVINKIYVDKESLKFKKLTNKIYIKNFKKN